MRDGRWDVVVVDCAPTAETLRLLALPEALALYASRAVPVGRRVARAVRAGLVGDTHDPVLTALHRLAGELADVRAVLTSPRTAVRLVLTPDSVVLAEARRSLTALALYGYPVDAAVVNRLVPDGADPWRSARAAAERDVLRSARESFGDVPLLEVPHAVAEPVGVDALAELAADLYRTHDPLEVVEREPVLDVERSGEEFVLRLRLPLAERDSLDLARRGDDLVLTVGTGRRVLTLPSALRRCRVVGASLRDGRAAGAVRARPRAVAAAVNAPRRRVVAAPVGSVHEETARLFAALEGAAAAWSRGEARPGRRAGRPRRTAADDAAHLPTTCGVCPVCLALDRVGRRHPEVLAHLGDAVQALGAAFTALTSDARRPARRRGPPPTASRPQPATERIDVTD